MGAVRVARVSIADPQRLGEGLSAFTSYKLTTILLESVPGLDGLSFTVVRRFRDFSWLRAELKDSFPFLIVPALPEKQQLGRFNNDFVEVRHRALQRWIERVAAHPELSGCELFKRFISLTAEALQSLREGSSSATAMVKDAALKSGKSIAKFLKSASSAAQGAIANARGGGGSGAGAAAAPTGGVRGTEDGAFVELEAYLSAQAPLLAGLYNAAATLAMKSREQAQLLLDFGSALRTMGQVDGGAVGDSLAAVGVATWASSTATYELAVCQTEAFVERLADYVRVCRAVKHMVDTRTRASGEVLATTMEVERVRAHLAAIATLSTPTAVNDRAQGEADQRAAQAAAMEARVYYDRVAAAVISETLRLRSSMTVDFRELLLDFTSAQLRTEQKLSLAWDAVAAKCSAARAGPDVGVVPVKE